MARPLKLKFFDIEFGPSLGFFWSAKVEYIPDVNMVSGPFMMTWSTKERGRPKVTSATLTPAEAVTQDDRRLVVGLAEELRDADMVVGHNVDHFDIRKLNARLFQLGEEPLGPIKTIDTLKIAKSRLMLQYNSLRYLANTLGLPAKGHCPMPVWIAAFYGDEKALRKLAVYNRSDTRIAEQVFERIRPYAKNLPPLFDPEEDQEVFCDDCGSHNLQKRGFSRTQVARYQRYQCNDCGSWQQSRSSKGQLRPAVKGI